MPLAVDPGVGLIVEDEAETAVDRPITEPGESGRTAGDVETERQPWPRRHDRSIHERQPSHRIHKRSRREEPVPAAGFRPRDDADDRRLRCRPDDLCGVRWGGAEQGLEPRATHQRAVRPGQDRAAGKERDLAELPLADDLDVHGKSILARRDHEPFRVPETAPKIPDETRLGPISRNRRAADLEGLVAPVEGIDGAQQPQLRPTAAVGVVEQGDAGVGDAAQPIRGACDRPAGSFLLDPHRTVTSASACWPKRTSPTVRSAAIRARRTAFAPTRTRKRRRVSSRSGRLMRLSDGSAIQPGGTTMETQASSERPRGFRTTTSASTISPGRTWDRYGSIRTANPPAPKSAESHGNSSRCRRASSVPASRRWSR